LKISVIKWVSGSENQVSKFRIRTLAAITAPEKGKKEEIISFEKLDVLSDGLETSNGTGKFYMSAWTDPLL
jgi:hypothetical protein